MIVSLTINDSLAHCLSKIWELEQETFLVNNSRMNKITKEDICIKESTFNRGHLANSYQNEGIDTQTWVHEEGSNIDAATAK
jgi:hypothetical protein